MFENQAAGVWCAASQLGVRSCLQTPSAASGGVSVGRARIPLPAEIASAPEHEPRGCLYISGTVTVDKAGRRLPGNWYYCQAARQAGSSYCSLHHAVCHRKIEMVPA